MPPEQQIVTAFPDVTVHENSDDDEFLVLACDGMFEHQPPPLCTRNLSLTLRQVSGTVNRHRLLSSSSAEVLPLNRLLRRSARI